jgi:hypothetical protein
MALCPFDFRGCIDDLCYGSGCLKLAGEPMVEPCPGGCGEFLAIDGSNAEACECGPDYDREDDREDDHDG